MKRIIFLIIVLMTSTPSLAGPACIGKFFNPITDLCWSCVMPITIGSAEVAPASGNLPDTSNYGSPVCVCPKAAPPYFRVGLAVGFWEPHSLSESTRGEPYCFVSLDGMSISNVNGAPAGTGENNGQGRETSAFYQEHWYIYPVFMFMSMFTNQFCQSQSDIDIAYITELDALWGDDELSNILNPESVLFANPIAQAACAADCVAATISAPLNAMFWCSGCSGSIFPLTGTVGTQYGVIQASELLTERMTFKLHREFFLMLTSTAAAICMPLPAPIMPKDQYRTQIVYPLPQTAGSPCCQPYGRTTTISQAGRSWPYTGEDAVNLVWRKRNCCISN
jgi:conjugal transfer pilus assembly protein TraU